MLLSLHVKDLALVDDVRVELQAGLSVITGETGAGKSVIIGALGLLLGERADRSVVRAGRDAATAEAVFALGDTGEIDAILEEAGADPCEAGELILRRVVAAAGTSRNFVNGCATTLQVLRRVGDLLVDMHGPYDHQSLLDRDFQLEVLDAYAQLGKARATYAGAHGSLLELEARRRALSGDDGAIAQRIDLLAYQVEELEQAALTADEEEEVAHEHRVAGNAQELLRLADGIRNALTEDDASAFTAAVAARRQIGEMAGLDPVCEPWRDDANGIVIQLQELSDTINTYAQGLESDPERLEWLDDRLSCYQRMKKKYGGSVEAALQHLERARTELDDLSARDERLAALEAERLALAAKRDEAGLKLRARRAKAAGTLAAAITGELRDLGFRDAAVAIELTPAAPRPSGMDAIELTFVPHKSEPPRPLRAIASSGEISRVMLAIKTVLARHDRIPLLVFDEVDANVGGEVGHEVGSKLAGLAEHHQVVAITHLPQVAVHGHAHFAVAKQTRNGRAQTEITALEGEARVEEVARMLGGRERTSVTMDHARELLQNAGRL